MANCSFCGSKIEQGTGMIFVKKDGRAFNFCSSKCRKYQLKLGRNPAKFKWTKYYKR